MKEGKRVEVKGVLVDYIARNRKRTDVTSYDTPAFSNRKERREHRNHYTRPFCKDVLCCVSKKEEKEKKEGEIKQGIRKNPHPPPPPLNPHHNLKQ